jgi:preprotein translocase subunit SecY
MWEKFRAIFTIPELRQKIFFTLVLLAVFRVGYQIPLPVIDQTAVKRLSSDTNSPFFNLMQSVSVLSAADLRRITIFGLGIMPYISASIILQLLGSVYKPLEDLRKEGETGRKKINEYTRYLTVLMCVIQGMIYLAGMTGGMSGGADGLSRIAPEFRTASGALNPMWYFTMICVMTCGTMFVMWLGEQIDEFGIGNGISLLIMAGILAQMPGALLQLFSDVNKSGWRLGGGTEMGVEHLIALAVLFVLVVAGVVFMQLGQRQIPTQSAKHVRGRRVYGGNRQYLPLRLNQSGVMPIIFASSLLMIPTFLFAGLASLFGTTDQGTVANWWQVNLLNMRDLFTRGNSLTYNLCYIALIYFFSYFWMAITFNPKEISENLKDFGTFIPGYRPGRRTAEYLEKVMIRITYVGAAFLAVVAIVPTIISASMHVQPGIASFYGGTGLLIAVSVAFDLIQKIDSHLVMRDYRGLLEP